MAARNCDVKLVQRVLVAGNCRRVSTVVQVPGGGGEGQRLVIVEGSDRNVLLFAANANQWFFHLKNIR